MKFTETPLRGAYVIELERHSDERGFFARTFCADEFAAHGLDPRIAQCSVSQNRAAGTLRGLHYQAAPHAETKLVRCTRGEIFDVIVDLRPGSPSFLGWFGVALAASTQTALYIPGGFAHGFLTSTDDTEVLYQISTRQEPSAARGLRWDDPALQIRWPQLPTVLNERDANYPSYAGPL